MNDRPAPGRKRLAWYWLLVVPYLATLLPQLYNRHDPPLFGMPFFYWYLLASIVLSGVVTCIVYLVTR